MRNKRLRDTVVSILSCRALERSSNSYSYIESIVFPRIRKESSLCGFDWKENPEKELRQWKKSISELKAEFLCIVWGREKK